MKKSFVIAACAVCAVSLVASADLNLTIDATDLGGDQYRIDIYGELTDASDGLALFGVNLTADQAIDLGAILDLDSTALTESFDRNDGLTNPPGPANSGFGGTPAGATLLQIGGGQNTIGNTAPPVYPVGSVLEGVAQDADPANRLLASGIIDVTGLTLPLTLTLDGGFANLLDAGQAGPVYSVTPVAVVNGDSVTIVGGVPPTVVDVFSMATHGGADLGIQIYPVPLVFGQPFNSESRYGLTQNVLEINLDGTLADASGVTVTATNTAMDVVNATVALDPAGDKLIATFSPFLPNAKIYTIDVSGSVAAFQCEYVTLTANVVNLVGMNEVNTTDRTILNTKLGQAAGVAGAQYDIFRIGASDGTVDTTDRVILNTQLGIVAN